MIKNMNKNMFKEYLLQTLHEISMYHNVNLVEKCMFTVVPIIEHGKSLNSTDEYLQRGMLNEKNLSGRELDFETVLNMIGCRIPLCPIWIKVSLKEIRDEVPIIELQTSLRFRKPRLCQNQDTGHPPCKAII